MRRRPAFGSNVCPALEVYFPDYENIFLCDYEPEKKQSFFLVLRCHESGTVPRAIFESLQSYHINENFRYLFIIIYFLIKC